MATHFSDTCLEGSQHGSDSETQTLQEIRRVHFSPQNQLIHSGMTPQSSPARASKRPCSRSILKVSNNSELLSLNGGEVGSQMLSSDESLFEQEFPTLVDKLHSLEDTEQLVSTYSRLGSLISQQPAKLPEFIENANTLLGYLQRDTTAITPLPRKVFLAAAKCLSYLLHVAGISWPTRSKQTIGELLLSMSSAILTQFRADKIASQAVFRCVYMAKVPAEVIQPAHSRLIDVCAMAISSHGNSSTITLFESLNALEALLKALPTPTRQLSYKWLFGVFIQATHPLESIQFKIDGIIRHNIPWLAADAHDKMSAEQRENLDRAAKEFIHMDLDSWLMETRDLMQENGGYIYAARIWGFLITICARTSQGRLNDMLKIIQSCFNSSNPRVLIATLAQWRCLIYAFYMDGRRINLKKCIRLVLTPIASVLRQNKDEMVRLASVKCWATLVYALGDNFETQMEMVVKDVLELLKDEQSVKVRGVVARVLASLFNPFVLPEKCLAQFVVPQMIIGTTTLAASDNRHLSNTHGPFSSKSDYTGDHTEIMCKYMVELPRDIYHGLFGHILEFIKEYIITVAHVESEDECLPFKELCQAIAKAAKEIDQTVEGSPWSRALVELFKLVSMKVMFPDRGGSCKTRVVPITCLFRAIHQHLYDVFTKFTAQYGVWVQFLMLFNIHNWLKTDPRYQWSNDEWDWAIETVMMGWLQSMNPICVIGYLEDNCGLECLMSFAVATLTYNNNLDLSRKYRICRDIVISVSKYLELNCDEPRHIQDVVAENILNTTLRIGCEGVDIYKQLVLSSKDGYHTKPFWYNFSMIIESARIVPAADMDNKRLSIGCDMVDVILEFPQELWDLERSDERSYRYSVLLELAANMVDLECCSAPDELPVFKNGDVSTILEESVRLVTNLHDGQDGMSRRKIGTMCTVLVMSLFQKDVEKWDWMGVQDGDFSDVIKKLQHHVSLSNDPLVSKMTLVKLDELLVTIGLTQCVVQANGKGNRKRKRASKRKTPVTSDCSRESSPEPTSSKASKLKTFLDRAEKEMDDLSEVDAGELASIQMSLSSMMGKMCGALKKRLQK